MGECMLEIIRWYSDKKQVVHKNYNLSLERYLNLLKQKFEEKYKQMLGLLPQQELQEYTVVRIRRKLALNDEVKTVSIDLFGIKKPDDVLVAVGIDPKDSSVKTVVAEQLSIARIDKNIVFNYKRMEFGWGVFKLRLVSSSEVSATFTILNIKGRDELKKEKLFYMAKKLYEVKEGRNIMYDELVEKLVGKRVVKVEMMFKQRFESYSDTGRQVNRVTKRVYELLIEH